MHHPESEAFQSCHAVVKSTTVPKSKMPHVFLKFNKKQNLSYYTPKNDRGQKQGSKGKARQEPSEEIGETFLVFFLSYSVHRISLELGKVSR